jgi:hypothetical protein
MDTGHPDMPQGRVTRSSDEIRATPNHRGQSGLAILFEQHRSDDRAVPMKHGKRPIVSGPLRDEHAITKRSLSAMMSSSIPRAVCSAPRSDTRDFFRLRIKKRDKKTWEQSRPSSVAIPIEPSRAD